MTSTTTTAATAATTQMGQCEWCDAHNAEHSVTYIDNSDGESYDKVTEQVCHQCYLNHQLEERIDRLAERVAELESNKRT